MSILGEFTSSQLAIWGAITGSVGLLVSLTLAFFQIRKALRESPKLRIDRASGGATYFGAHRWDSITAFAINEGGATVSITNYGVEVYESKSVGCLDVRRGGYAGMDLNSGLSVIVLPRPCQTGNHLHSPSSLASR